MCFKLCLAQTGYPPNGDVTSLVESVALRAQQQGAALLAFPENLMHPRELTTSELALLAEPLDGPFVQDLLSKEHIFRGSSNQRLIDVPASLAAGAAVEAVI